MYDVELIIIAAMTRSGIIGQHGKLPWHIPEELALFRRLTMGHCLIMGRKTFISLGRPLPGRTNIVVSRGMPPVAGVIVCRDFDSAVRRAGQESQKVFFIGGRDVYRQALAIAHRMHISWIDKAYPGDCFFPPVRQDEWLVVSEQAYAEFRHVVYRRR
ncbi:MAG: dihydrofolate reductase [Syntrophotalea acetylenica]|nr:dihydrofolate reductase [Syntrophotalea acetylenica]